jgi:hypothetical protein
LADRSDQLISLAWGVNGFASVSATPLAVILASAGGFTMVMVLALGLYLLAGLSTLSFHFT